MADSTVRLFVFLIGAIALAAGPSRADSCPAGFGAEDLRLKISLFRYSGAIEGEARNRFSQFRGILRDKIHVLAEELGSGSGFDYAERLSLFPKDTEALDDTLNDAQLRNYWRQSHSLLLLRGNISVDEGRYTALSVLFFGDLRGNLPRESLRARLPIVDEEFARATDTHSLTILYAMAMDAARIGCSPALVVDLLSRAQDKYLDLRDRDGAPAADLLAFERAIQRAIETQRLRVVGP